MEDRARGVKLLGDQNLKKIEELEEDNRELRQQIYHMRKRLGCLTNIPNPFSHPPDSPGGIVYFLQRSDGLIKIGCTNYDSFNKRMTTLRREYEEWSPLVFLGWEPGYKRQEALCHSEFLPFRVFGEWFTPDEDLLSYIGELNETHGRHPEVKWIEC